MAVMKSIVIGTMMATVATTVATVVALRKFVKSVLIHLTFPEYTGTGECLSKNLEFSYIERYLNSDASITRQAKKFNTNIDDDGETFFTIAEEQLVMDVFNGGVLFWTLVETPEEDQKRYYCLTFYKGYRQPAITRYTTHVLNRGKSLTERGLRA